MRVQTGRRHLRAAPSVAVRLLRYRLAVQTVQPHAQTQGRLSTPPGSARTAPSDACGDHGVLDGDPPSSAERQESVHPVDCLVEPPDEAEGRGERARWATDEGVGRQDPGEVDLNGARRAGRTILG